MKTILDSLKNNPAIILELLGMATGIVVWVSTMNGVPEDIKRLNKRVDVVEERVRILEQNLEKNNVKTDLILSAVYQVRQDIKDYHRK